MKIATWNVNSIRTRKDHIVQWLQTNPVDILCLQETKVIDKDFPRAVFEDLGYHVYIYGQKAYNGVAIFSKNPLESIYFGFSGILNTQQSQDFDQQKRVLTGIINNIAIVNLYVPNGSSLDSDKYQYKLNWLTCLKGYLEFLLTQTPNLCICGIPICEKVHKDPLWMIFVIATQIHKFVKIPVPFNLYYTTLQKRRCCSHRHQGSRRCCHCCHRPLLPLLPLLLPLPIAIAGTAESPSS